MRFIRDALGGAIALCLACLVVLVVAPNQPPASAFRGEPPPDGGTAALGAPDPNAVAGETVRGSIRSLRQLASEEPTIAPAFNVYASTIDGAVDPRVASIPPRVYVPNSTANTVDVIDPLTFQVVDHFRVGSIPHHITPSWDLTKLYIENEGSSLLTVIDPKTGKVTGNIAVPFPYNLYFTPDGKKAIVVVERLARLDFRDPNTWQLIKSVPIPWRGIDHLDFSADGSYLIGSTEWSGILVKIDTRTMQITGSLNVGGLPIDVRLAPAGDVFYVTNQGRHGVSIVDPVNMRELAFLPTARGAHGLQVSRDTHFMYVSNRDAGSISVIDLRARTVVATWKIGGSPDMLQLSPDGKQLWASGRYYGTVAVVDTETGQLLKTIRAGAGAHGLTYFPNAGSISTGHNGVYR
ncbi:MAG TPA: YncE family protein [Candidatus Dormibacteraeota bacterium]|jgi:YVTN family beta-propeller protein